MKGRARLKHRMEIGSPEFSILNSRALFAGGGHKACKKKTFNKKMRFI